jgi:predicted tellurium resistance membrane protein TerC
MLRRVWLATLIAMVGYALLQEVRGDGEKLIAPPPPVEGFPRALIDPGGEEVALLLAEIPVHTAIETRLVQTQHIQRVTFQRDPDADHAEDTIQLRNKSLIRGKVMLETFPVRAADGTVKTLKRTDLREIRMLHPKDVSILAVVIALLTLTAMEIVLGIDNVIFLAIVAAKLPLAQQPKARRIGLAAALGTRLLLLFMLSFLLGLTTPIFSLPDLPFLQDVEAREVSWRDIILFVGGAFLIGKSVLEMHEKMEHARTVAEGSVTPPKPTSFARVIATIAVIDIVFSLDSVITAVGMVDEVWVMVVAMVIAMIVMLIFAGPISRFVEKHPTVKVLALSFLILIGVMLVAESLGQHLNKGYIYFAMAFGVGVEMVNMKLRGKGHTTEDSEPAASASA